MHQTAIAYGSEHGGKRNVEAQNAGSQIAIGQGYGMARAESDVVEDPAVFAQRDLAVSAAIQVIKNRPGESAASEGPEIVDTDDAGRCHCTFRSSHWLVPYH
jgi:hypothetical protein